MLDTVYIYKSSNIQTSQIQRYQNLIPINTRRNLITPRINNPILKSLKLNKLQSNRIT
jgi:hypothetical protein